MSGDVNAAAETIRLIRALIADGHASICIAPEEAEALVAEVEQLRGYRVEAEMVISKLRAERDAALLLAAADLDVVGLENPRGGGSFER